MRGIIYKYNSPEGKTYIGQTLTEEKKRKYRHKSDAKNRPNTPFARAINKYGWEEILKTYEIIEEIFCDDKNELKEKLTERENFYITELNTLLPNGYNVQLTNQKSFGEYRNKKLMYEKIGDALRGKYLNGVQSKKVMNFNTKEIYPSISEASRKTGICVQAICGALKGKNLSAGGFRWCYTDENGNIDETCLRPKKRKDLKVYCVELDKTFISAYEAEKFLKKPNGKSNIRLACEKGWKSYGYTWKYVD